MPDLKISLVLGDIMNGNQALAGNQAVQAQDQNAGNKTQACNTERWLTALFFGLIIAVLVGGAIYWNEMNREWKKENDPKIFEKFDVPHDLWKTLISAKDDPTNIEKESNENFQTIWVSYFKAKSYVANYRGELTTDVVDDFSQFSTQMEKETKKILGRTFGEYHGGMTIAKRIIAKNKSAKGLNFKKYMKIMQEAYFKRFIKVFQLRPEDLDTIPCLHYHCRSFKITLGSG